MTNLRIAFVAGTLGLGGAEKQFLYIARSVKLLQMTPIIFTFDESEYYEKFYWEAGIEVRIIFGKSRIQQIWNLYSQLIEFQPHIIQSCSFYRNLYVSLASKAIGAVDIGAIRNNALLELGNGQLWRIASLYLSSSLICNSDKAMLNLMEMGISENKISALKNVIDLDEFDSFIDNKVEQNHNYFAVLVARLSKEKRIDRFIRAIVIARNGIPNLKVAIVGDGPCKVELMNLRDDLGLSNNVIFLGQKDNNCIPVLLASASALVLTSDYEGFPNVVMEGMAASLPVISTPAGDVPNVIQDGITGFLVNYDDVDQIANLLVKLYHSPTLGIEIGKNAREYIEGNYSINLLPAKLHQIYSKIYQAQHNRISYKKRSDWEYWISNNNKLYDK